MTDNKSTLDKVNELAEQATQDEGFALYHVEILGKGTRPIVRVYLEPAEGSEQASVTLDECGRVSRRLSTLMEVEDPMSGAFILEVSSPGLDRHLYHPGHYKRVIGQTVKVKTYSPVEGRRHFEGRLTAVDNEHGACLDVEGQEITLDFDNVAKARVVFSPPGA